MDPDRDDCFDGLYEYIGEDPNAQYDDTENGDGDQEDAEP